MGQECVLKQATFQYTKGSVFWEVTQKGPKWFVFVFFKKEKQLIKGKFRTNSRPSSKLSREFLLDVINSYAKP